MKRLLKYLSAYKKECILGPLFKLLEASFELIVPLVIAQIVDHGIKDKDTDKILWMSLILLLLAAVGLASSITAQYFAAKAATGFAAKVRAALFSHIETFSFQEMDEMGTSTLITRMTSDVNQVQSGVNMVLRLFLRSPFIVFGAMIMAFSVNVKAAMVFVVTIPLLTIVVFGVMIASIPLFRKVQKGLDDILGKTRENLAGVRVIRAFHKEEEEKQQFEQSNRFLTNMQIVVGRISAMTNPLTYIIINFSIIAVVWIGARQVYAGIIPQGMVLALVSYMSQILVELVKLANLIVNVTKSLACAGRIADVLDISASVQDPKTNQPQYPVGKEEPYITFSHVNMRYEGGSEDALSDIDFAVEKGQTIGIIGGTGSGKTTLVHLLPRFYDVAEGSLRIAGKDVRDYPLEELRDKIGIVMQKAVLFSGSIAQNLRWGKADATEEEMWKALEVAQAVDVVKEKEDGLEYHIEEGGKNLSGGQKQRLTIARAIVKDPEILILDDSASALDFATDANLRKALKENMKQKTVFLVSQRTSSIQHADKILVLDDGHIAGFDTHKNLLETCEIYREIYDSQFKKEQNPKEGMTE